MKAVMLGKKEKGVTDCDFVELLEEHIEPKELYLNLNERGLKRFEEVMAEINSRVNILR